jgi:oligopeptide transport system permease protein
MTTASGAAIIGDETRAIQAGESPGRQCWRRFSRNRPAVVALVVLMVICLLCVATVGVSAGRYQVQELEFNRCGPSLWGNFAPFGYDTLGRNLLWRCLFGGVISLGIGLAAAVISVSIGTLWGLVAGFYGGKIDGAMMRVVDILYGLPYILLVILLKMAFEPKLIILLNGIFGGGQERVANVVILFVAIGSVSWLTMARVVRGQVLSLKEQAFIESARALGMGHGRILLRHLLPNLTGPIIVYATLTVPQAILQESFLSFLGIGIQSPIPSWGTLAAEAVKAINPVESFWWMVAFPCGLLAITLLCLNFIGDGLRDAFDPRTIK